MRNLLILCLLLLAPLVNAQKIGPTEMAALKLIMNQETAEKLIDGWAKESFDSCYPGRTYQSVSVSDYNVSVSDQTLEVKGDITYLNLLDINVTWEFEATLKFYSSGAGKMTFWKYDGVLEEWEKCVRNYEK